MTASAIPLRVDADELFPLTLGQAAELLGVQPDDLATLVQVGRVGAYLRPVGYTDELPTMRFRESDLGAYRERLPRRLTPERIAVLRGLLRRYLERHPPRPDAADRDCPVLARDRGDQVYAHVQVRALQRWMRWSAVTTEEPAGMPFVIPTTVVDALRELSCEPMRGIRPLGCDRQLWGTWWRLPRELWSLDMQQVTELGEVRRG